MLRKMLGGVGGDDTYSPYLFTPWPSKLPPYSEQKPSFRDIFSKNNTKHHAETKSPPFSAVLWKAWIPSRRMWSISVEMASRQWQHVRTGSRCGSQMSIILYQVLPSDPFGSLKWPFQGLSDLHFMDQRVTWKMVKWNMWSNHRRFTLTFQRWDWSLSKCLFFSFNRIHVWLVYLHVWKTQNSAICK